MKHKGCLMYNITQGCCTMEIWYMNHEAQGLFNVQGCCTCTMEIWYMNHEAQELFNVHVQYNTGLLYNGDLVYEPRAV